MRSGRRSRLGGLLLTTVLVPGGCDGASTIAPPAIRYGVDACAECGMIISDERYAAAVVLDEGRGPTPRPFDDLGCLLAHEGSDATILARYVRHLDGERWLEAEAATFLHSNDLRSPMAYGTGALDGREEARARQASTPGDVLDFAAVRDRFERGVLLIDPSATTDPSPPSEDDP